MRSAPAPDLLPIPGMDPGTIVAGGGGGSGDGDGSAGEGGDGEGGNGGNGGNDANGGGPGAGACGQGANGSCPNCSSHAQAGDPVDVLTGEVFTIPKTDLDLAGFFALRIDRSYSTARRTRNVGMGWGWTHSLAWEMHRHGRTLEVRDSLGRHQGFQFVEQQGGESTIGGWGIRRVGHGFFLRAGDEFLHILPCRTLPTRTSIALLRSRTGVGAPSSSSTKEAGWRVLWIQRGARSSSRQRPAATSDPSPSPIPRAGLSSSLATSTTRGGTSRGISTRTASSGDSATTTTGVSSTCRCPRA